MHCEKLCSPLYEESNHAETGICITLLHDILSFGRRISSLLLLSLLQCIVHEGNRTGVQVIGLLWGGIILFCTLYDMAEFKIKDTGRDQRNVKNDIYYRHSLQNNHKLFTCLSGLVTVKN